MYKAIEPIQVENGIEITLEHPLKEFGDIEMYVVKLSTNQYIFSIPFHNWTYFRRDEQNIHIVSAPGSYRYSPYKEELTKTMEEAIEILNKPRAD